MKINQLCSLAFALAITIVLDGCSGGGGSSAPTTGASTTGVLAQIQTQMDGIASLYTAGLPTPAAITAKLAPGFLMDGMNATAYATQVTTAPAPVAAGDKFVLTLATVFDDASQSNAVADTQWVNATQYNAAGAIVGASRVKFIKVGGIWLIAGNERAVRVSMRAESAMASAVVPATFSSDVNVSVDPTTASSSGIATVSVSGATIVTSSATGITVYSNSVPATQATAAQTSVIPLCDTTITTHCTNAADGSEYTLTLNDSAGAVIATYKEVLNKAPLPATALTAALFPTFGTVSPSTIAGVTSGAAMSLSWTNSAGLVSNWADYTVWDSNGQLVFQLSGPPTANSFAGTMPVFTLVTGVAVGRFDVSVQGADVYGRQYVAFK